MIEPAGRRKGVVVIMAGGTGGHVYPGLAVARAMSDRGYRIAWLGSSGGMEEKLVATANQQSNMNIRFCPIDISGIRGKGVKALITAPFKVRAAVNQAREKLVQISPQCVVGMGGFVAGPGGRAAAKMKLPLVIHEQNAIAGTTNKILSWFASRVLVAFPGSLRKGECIGNPVRREIEALAAPAERFAGRSGPVRILVMGGSRGALAINEMVPAALSKVSHVLNYEVVHQTGEAHFEKTQSVYAERGINANVRAYIDDVPGALEWADLVVARSGALTVSEVAAAGVAAIFIPFPHAIDDHQTANAHYLADAGAAVVMQQRDLSPEILAVKLNELLASRTTLLKMAEAARGRAKPGAAEKFADICEELIND